MRTYDNVIDKDDKRINVNQGLIGTEIEFSMEGISYKNCFVAGIDASVGVTIMGHRPEDNDDADLREIWCLNREKHHRKIQRKHQIRLRPLFAKHQ